MEFDVATQSLKCPNCNATREIKGNKEFVKEHKLTNDAKRQKKASEKTSSTMQCPSCGAIVEVEATSTAKDCPYCGTAFVLAKKQLSNVVPDAILPFRIDKHKVGEIFRDWMKGRWLAPSELKNLYQQDKLQGIYIPYWTFDANAFASYHADGGKEYTVERKNEKGEIEKKIEVRWVPTGGTVKTFFDDVLVHASDKLDSYLIQSIKPFHTKNIPAYSPEYLSGYNSEVYTINLEDANKTAKQIMHSSLVDMAEKDVLRRFDRVRNVHIDEKYENETYKHIMLPIYATAYHYKNKTYTVLINGENGNISGEYPKSPVKIILLVFGILLIISIFIFLCGFAPLKDKPTSMNTNAYETAYLELETELPIHNYSYDYDYEYVELEEV